MPGDKGNVITQRQQSLTNRTDQGAVISARQVGASNRSREQDIADQSQTPNLVEEDHVTRRMPWTVQYIQYNVANADLIALFQPACWREGPPALREPEHLRLPGHPVNPELVVTLRPFDRQIQPLCQIRDTARVVDVPMRYQHLLQSDLLALDNGQQPIQIAAWIDNRCPAGLLTPEQRAVLLKRGYRNNFVRKRHKLSPISLFAI